MEAKRQSIVDLFHAQIPFKRITKIIEVNLSTVYKVTKSFAARNTIKRKEGSSRHNKKRTKSFLEDLNATIESDPTMSLKKLAKSKNVSQRMIQLAMKDLGFKSYVRRRRQLLTERMRATRLDKAKKLCSWLKKSNRSTMKIFSDKKMFTVDQARNCHNDQSGVLRGQHAPNHDDQASCGGHDVGCRLLRWKADAAILVSRRPQNQHADLLGRPLDAREALDCQELRGGWVCLATELGAFS